MTPFQQLRHWYRRASPGARTSTLVALIVVAGSLAYVATPTDDIDASSVSASDTLAGAPTGSPTTMTTAAAPDATNVQTAPAGPEAQSPGDPAAPAPTPPAGQSPAGTAACASPPGSDQGVTDSQIKIVVSLSELGGPLGNETFGIASAPEQRRAFEVVTAALNKSGGIACRKLVIQYFTSNTLDQSQQQRTCLDILRAQPFAVIDVGAFYTPASAKTCFPIQGKVPFFAAAGLTEHESDRYFPYLFSTGGALEQLYRNTVPALRSRGFFDPARGFKKLGFLYHDCDDKLTGAMLAQLRAAGVAESSIVSYNLGCQEGFASPADLQQAILKFRQAGVTHQTFTNIRADFANFTKQADQQGYRPVWGIPDEAVVATSKGALAADAENIDGAVAITDGRWGEDSVPWASSPGTARCDAIFKAAGMKPVRQQQSGMGGVACNDIWMLAAAIEHAPALRRDTLAQGLRAARSVDFSYPVGPSDFTAGPRVTSGGQFWRAVQFSKACACWKPVAPEFGRRFG